eukprot:gene14973-16516_t
MDFMKSVANFWFSALFRRKKLSRGTKQNKGLTRCLSTTHLISLGVGATLGAGTYVVTGQVAANIAGPSVTISFTIAAFTSIMSGLCYAEFGSRVPKTTGSAYTYSYVTVGEIWAFVIGWNLILEYMIGTAADAAALSGAFDYAIGYRVRNLTLTYIGEFNTPYLGDYPDFLSFLFTIIVTIILALGVRESAHFTTLFNVFNVAVVFFIIVTGLFYVDIRNWTEGAGFFPYGGMGVLSGAATCFYAFVGFDVIATTGEEATNAPKSIPVAIVASLLLVFVAYFGVSSVITLMIPFHMLDKRSPIPDAFRQRGLPWANYIISVGAICGLSSSLLGNLFPLPRIILAMAHDGLLFDCLGKVHERTGVPVNATVYPGILTAFFALVFDLQELVEMMSIGTLLAYSLVSLCVLILRYQPDDHIDYDYDHDHEHDHELAERGISNEDVELKKELKGRLEKQSGESTEGIPGNNSDQQPLIDLEQQPQIDLEQQSQTSLEQQSQNNLGSVDENKLELEDEKRRLSGEEIFHRFDERVDDHDESTLLLGKPDNNKAHQSDVSAPSSGRQNRKQPTLWTGRVVSCSSLLLLLWFFGFNSTLVFAFDEVVSKQVWALALLVLFGVLSIASIVVIVSMPQSTMKFGFMAPCVPGMPILAIYCNIFLMLRLSTITWVRFAAWMIIGALIYLLYGTWYSKTGIQKKKELSK